MTALTTKSIKGDIAIAVAFFTRIPLPLFDLPDRKLGHAIWAAPVAGLVVALIGAAVFTFCDIIGMTSALAAGFALASMMLTTGCLHEDGLADTADAFGGGKTIERKLEIMHDSRIGTFGAAALMSSMLIRWAAMASIFSGVDIVCALIASQVGSRAIFGELIRRTPQARDSGLAASVGPVSRETAIAALLIGGVSLFLIGVIGAILAGILGALAVYAFRQFTIRQIGGVTGDTLGASQQVAEIVILSVASAMFS